MSYYYENICRKACQQCINCANNNYNRIQNVAGDQSYEFCTKACTKCNNCYFDNSFAINTESTKPWFSYLSETNPLITYRPYRPYNIYRYTKSWKCDDVCDPDTCKQHLTKLRNYRGCIHCQLQNPPKCWNSETMSCESCSLPEARTSCQDRYGCKNPRGFPHRGTRPVNPIYTGCKLCW